MTLVDVKLVLLVIHKIDLFSVAELGGYLGMILGVSLLHLEHVFESIDKQSKIDNTLYVKENV